LLGVPLPNYRFRFMLEYAKSFVGQVVQFGGMLLSYLERIDNEDLSTKYANNQAAILDLMSTTKNQLINQANAAIAQLNSNINATTNRKQYYDDLISQGLLPEEIASKVLKLGGQVFAIESQVALIMSQICYIIPTNGAGTAGLGPYEVVKLGGENFGHAAEGLSHGLQIAADIQNFVAEQLLSAASDKRREQEWEQQQQAARDELDILNKQLLVSNIGLEIAQNELVIHQQSIKQQQDILDFYQKKFTNIELYRWMSAQLLTLNKQAYDMALSIAKSAEKAYQYEFGHLPGSTPVFITSDDYSYQRKGLLAGESLMLKLNQMEKAFLDNSKRLYEITKIISLKTLNPSYIDKLKKDGKTTFTIDKKFLDDDFDQLAYRRIKKIRVTIPALTSPYRSINLFLTQEKPNYFVREDSSGTSIAYPIWMNKMMISTGMSDSGMFEESAMDSRYNPFEGSSVDGSTWTLALGHQSEENKALLNSVNDVIIQLQYTAVEAAPDQNENDTPSRGGRLTNDRHMNAKVNIKSNYGASSSQFFKTKTPDLLSSPDASKITNSLQSIIHKAKRVGEFNDENYYFDQISNNGLLNGKKDNCGYISLGITRTDMQNKLQDNIHNPAVKKQISKQIANDFESEIKMDFTPEIKRKISANHQALSVAKEKMNNILKDVKMKYSYLFSGSSLKADDFGVNDLLALLAKNHDPENCIGILNKAKSALTEAENNYHHYFENEEVIADFIKFHTTNDWLGVHVAIAWAMIVDTTLRIWIHQNRKTNSKEILLKDGYFYESKNNKPAIDIIHTSNATHFERLRLLAKKPCQQVNPSPSLSKAF